MHWLIYSPFCIHALVNLLDGLWCIYIYSARPSSSWTIIGNSEVGPVIGSRSRLKFGQQYPWWWWFSFLLCFSRGSQPTSIIMNPVFDCKHGIIEWLTLWPIRINAAFHRARVEWYQKLWEFDLRIWVVRDEMRFVPSNLVTGNHVDLLFSSLAARAGCDL